MICHIVLHQMPFLTKPPFIWSEQIPAGLEAGTSPGWSSWINVQTSQIQNRFLFLPLNCDGLIGFSYHHTYHTSAVASFDCWSWRRPQRHLTIFLKLEQSLGQWKLHHARCPCWIFRCLHLFPWSWSWGEKFESTETLNTFLHRSPLVVKLKDTCAAVNWAFFV